MEFVIYHGWAIALVGSRAQGWRWKKAMGANITVMGWRKCVGGNGTPQTAIYVFMIILYSVARAMALTHNMLGPFLQVRKFRFGPWLLADKVGALHTCSGLRSNKTTRYEPTCFFPGK